MSENKFWSIIWGMIFTFLAFVILVSTSCHYKDLEHQEKLVEKTVDYLAIRCAGQTQHISAVCLKYSQEGEK